MALNTKESDRIFNEAKNLMPGGVSSPVRAFKVCLKHGFSQFGEEVTEALCGAVDHEF
jgi:glutamate-1-semialdehyde aminotransferase